MKSSDKQHVKDLIGKSFDISSLLDYQDDAFVSREIIKKGAWSSYAHRAEGKSSTLLDYDPAYLNLGKTKEEW